MNSKTLSWIGIGFLMWQVLKGAGSAIASYFDIGIPRIKLGKLTFTGLRAQVFLPIINRSPASVPIDSFQGSLLYGQYNISNLYLDRPVQIERNGSTELQFNVFMDFGRLSDNVVDMISNGQYLNSFRIKGHITSKGVVFPVDQPIQII